ncbi:MAG: competence/damage-inducible protein A, partial [Deltaproteobacteria bacterium]
MEAQIVTIGEELLSGATLDTNSRFLAETLHRFGIRVRKIVTVGDELEGIVRALREAAQGAELVLVTGGLGPTPDDRTREAAAEAFDLRLLLHEDYLRELKEKFAAWGLTFTETDEAQAQLPEGAEIIPNPLGLCGFRLQVRGCHLFFFPGVPKELRSMVQGTLIPFLSERSGGETVLVRLLKCFGPTESQVKELLEGLSGPFELAFLPSFPEIHLRLTVRGGTPEEAAGHLSAYEAEIRRRLGLHLFGSGDDTMEKVVGQLLRERGATIATAESCTGGLVA